MLSRVTVAAAAMLDELVVRFLADVNNFCLKLIILHYGLQLESRKTDFERHKNSLFYIQLQIQPKTLGTI